MWSVHGFGITLVVLLSCGDIRARVVPETTSDKSTEETVANRYKFLDQVSASKIECLLKFIEQPGATPKCIDTLFGDERSQFLLSELTRELKGESYPNERTTNDKEDKNDQLVADLNTLSGKAGILSTVNDDVPMINNNKEKRVEEQVDTPKKEEQRDGDLEENNQDTVAEVVKSVDENEDSGKSKNGIDNVEDDYEYDSSLVSKLYNMLQDLVMKETFDYGLNMDEDDDDSDEDQPENMAKAGDDGEEEEDDNANAGDQDIKNIKFKGQMFGGKPQSEMQEESSDSEEEEQGIEQAENKIAKVKVDENDDVEEDEIEKELKQMQGTQIDGERKKGDDDDDDDGAENVAELENDLVQELDRMLSIARQVGGGKDKPSYKTDVDVFSNEKFLEDLRNMEKQLKKSSG